MPKPKPKLKPTLQRQLEPTKNSEWAAPRAAFFYVNSSFSRNGSIEDVRRVGHMSAASVKELRERTGLGLLECKKALAAAGGDIE